MASDIARLLGMINGYQQTCVVVTALQLDVFERLARGPASVAVLASDLGVDASALARLVRALAGQGLVEQRPTEVALTATGKLLLRDGFGAGLRAWALLVGEEYYAAWGNLAHSVRTGEVAFDRVFGTSAWQHRQDHPALDEHFNRVTSGEQRQALAAVLRAYDFTGSSRIVDVGGGHGNLVAGILAKYPAARGIVFDQPHVVAGASPAIARAGVADRCETIGGSFFDSIPAGGDHYLLKHVLHNWDDDACIAILRCCRTAMTETARLLVLENVVPDDAAAAGALAMLDLHMLAVLGGRERTRSEYVALLEAAELRCARVIATTAGAPAIIEATR